MFPGTGGDRSGLQQIQRAVPHGPLDVLLGPVVGADVERDAGERDELIAGQARSVAVGGIDLGHADGSRGHGGALGHLVADALFDHFQRAVVHGEEVA